MNKTLKDFLKIESTRLLRYQVVNNILQFGVQDEYSEAISKRHLSDAYPNPNIMAMTVRLASTDRILYMLDNCRQYRENKNEQLKDICKRIFGVESNIRQNWYLYEVMYDTHLGELIFRCVHLVGENSEGYYLEELSETDYIDKFGNPGLINAVLTSRC